MLLIFKITKIKLKQNKKSPTTANSKGMEHRILLRKTTTHLNGVFLCLNFNIGKIPFQQKNIERNGIIYGYNTSQKI